MKSFFRNIFLRKYILLFLAVVLFTLSFVFNKLYSNRSSVSREVRIAENYINDQQNDFNEFLKNKTIVRKLLQKNETLNEFTQIASKSYGIFLYTGNTSGTADMQFWSDQLVIPPPETFTMDDGEYFLHLSNGYYFTIKKIITIDGVAGNVLSYAMIPLRSEFFIETDYLPHEFTYNRLSEKRVQISEAKTEFPVKTASGKILFYLDKKVSGGVPYNDNRTILLRFSAILFLFLFIHLFVEAVARKSRAWKAIGLLAILLIILRVGSYYFPSLLNLRQFDLFSPVIYGSNLVQRSLGDLLINAVLFCWIVLFAWSKLLHIENPVSIFALWLKWVSGILSLCLLILSTFILATVIRSMVADSKISFDVTDFFSMDQYTVVGFVVLACLSLSYYYLSQLLFRFIFLLFPGKTILIYFGISLTGLIYLTSRSGDPTVLFFIPVLVWLLIYTWLANRQGVIFNRIRINLTGILFWIFVFSVSIATIMLKENGKVEWEKRKGMADKLAVQTDPSSERLMNIAIQYLDNDFLSSNYYRFANAEISKAIRDSIITENYSGYLNKYDTRLYVYDANDKALNNDDPTFYQVLNTIINVQSKKTNITGLYYNETSYDQSYYITRRYITDTAGKKMGSFFIISNPKKYSSDALFPELFKKYKKTDPENSPTYSNAVYDSNKLVSPQGKYPFAISLLDNDVPRKEVEKRTNGDFDELWYKANKEKVVVIARKSDTIIETITLFSYIFCSFLFLVAIVQLISLILKTGYNWKGIRKLLQLNIRNQVHTTIIFVSVFSFLVIGISIISFFISRYNRNNTDRLSRTMKIMVNEMQKKISDNSTFDDVVKIYDSAYNYKLQNLVNEVSDIHGVDVNVYDQDGNLKVTSEANVYSQGVLSKKMDPMAFYHLSRLRQVQHAQEEKIGNLYYLSIYSPVREKDGKVYAYINIPYFTSQSELNKEISNFLVTIINLNAFIFLISGLIALFITNRITSSFSVISDKMKEVNLGKMNEAIVWSKDDEIGDLVIEYNKMVAKLGESAVALAKSEREGAWREMARQVAHEIKNPLTPMKLSIQYLQKAINNNLPNVKELSGSVANTLVEQIDHLSKIAADFSQFANISTTSVELFDLHEVIGSLKDLYQHNSSVEIDWKPVNERVMIQADKTQMNRLFTNLFANAMEACNGTAVCRIEVVEEREDGTIRISVKDNGEGIAPDMQSKIFSPNFTTKSSGTGLGLAMCKGIVEQAKGKIWFETGHEKGTTFHVELSLAN